MVIYEVGGIFRGEVTLFVSQIVIDKIFLWGCFFL